MSVTDDRQTDGREIAYSESECEFTFAKKLEVQALFGHFG